MATDYRDDTLSADRYVVIEDAPAKETRTVKTPAPYTGTNVAHPRFPQYRKDMTSAQKRAHTRAGKPRKAAPVTSAPVKVAAVKVAPVAVTLTSAEVVRTFAKPVAGLSKKSAALIATVLATPANVDAATWALLREVAAKPSTFDVLTLRARMGVTKPVKAARKAA
jgi:hypothetical protein